MKKVFLLGLILSGCSFTQGVELPDLKGLTMQQVQKSQGSPVVKRIEGEKQLWTYKKGACSVLVFFDASQTVQFAESRGNCK